MSDPRLHSSGDDNEALILYQGEIVQFGRSPRNFGVLPGANVEAHGDSPICGDHMTLYMDIRAAMVMAAQFTSSACCAVCKASASLMTDGLKNKSLIEVHLLKRAFLRTIEQGQALPMDRTLLGPLTVFERLRHIPSRIECAMLPWTTLQTALDLPLLTEPPSDNEVAPRRHQPSKGSVQ
jgi:nitrogen fixation protein NifU and related proteins